MTYKNKENTQSLVWLVIAKKHNLLPFRIISHQIKQLDLSQNSSQNQKKHTLSHQSSPNACKHAFPHHSSPNSRIPWHPRKHTQFQSYTHTQKQLVRVFFLTKFKRAHLISSFLIITRIVDPVIVFLTNMQQTYPT